MDITYFVYNVVNNTESTLAILLFLMYNLTAMQVNAQ